MREIKFRGKRIDNGEWVYGYYLIVDNKHLIFPPNAHFNQIGYYSKKGCFGEILQEGTCWICEVDRESVWQFTGLKDKNGKEIYEWDIVQTEHGRYLVQWDEESARYTALNKTKRIMLSPENWFKHEVIGNIWDNPELLEKGGY